jgi:hypothetical protein
LPDIAVIERHWWSYAGIALAGAAAGAIAMLMRG